MTDNKLSKPANAQWVESLSTPNQKLLLYMTMYSLRQSWRKPERRALMVGHLTETIPNESVAAIDLGNVYKTTTAFYGRYQSNIRSHDGRIFRRYYQQLESEVELAPDTVERLSYNIPDDMSWGEWKMEQLRSDAEEGVGQDQ